VAEVAVAVEAVAAVVAAALPAVVPARAAAAAVHRQTPQHPAQGRGTRQERRDDYDSWWNFSCFRCSVSLSDAEGHSRGSAL